MGTFNLELNLDDFEKIKQILNFNIRKYSNKIFESKVDNSPYRSIFLKNLINTYSDNLVSIYLTEANKLNNNKFMVEWKSSNIEISIEDFENFQHSLTDEFLEMFSKIENKLFSVKQIDSSGQAVNLILKLDSKQEYKYNSLKKIICFYITNN